MRYLRHAEDITFHEEARSVQRSMIKRYANGANKGGIVTRTQRSEQREGEERKREEDILH